MRMTVLLCKAQQKRGKIKTSTKLQQICKLFKCISWIHLFMYDLFKLTFLNFALIVLF